MNPVVISSSLNSISLRWDPKEKVSSERQVDELSKERQQFTVQYCEGGDTKKWTTVYKGLKNFHMVKNLAPGNYYNLRVGTSNSERDAVKWSCVLIGTTKEEPVAIVDIHEAIRKGNLSALRHLINSRMIAVDIYNVQGMSPLMEATAKCDIGAIAILLWAGADVEHLSAGVGKTALMIALQNGHIKAGLKLAEAGAQWETKDRRGCTALHYAVESSQVEAVKFALESGANLEAKDKYGWTPLKRALIVRSSIETLKELLKNGASVNLPPIVHGETEKPTPLMCAVVSCRGDNDAFAVTIPLLIKSGADTLKTNAYGHTAADMATAMGYKFTSEADVFYCKYEKEVHIGPLPLLTTESYLASAEPWTRLLHSPIYFGWRVHSISQRNGLPISQTTWYS